MPHKYIVEGFHYYLCFHLLLALIPLLLMVNFLLSQSPHMLQNVCLVFSIPSKYFTLELKYLTYLHLSPACIWVLHFVKM